MSSRRVREKAPEISVARIGAIWLVALIVAYLSATAALASASRELGLNFASRQFPGNGFAYGHQASLWLASDLANPSGQQERVPDSIVTMARTGLASEPYADAAATVLGIAAEREGNPLLARKLVRAAAAISKRDSIATSWLIVDYGKLDQLDPILALYDRSMRVDPSTRPVYVERLSKTLALPQSVDPLSQLLSSRPPWEIDFWREAIGGGVGLENAARLRAGLKRDPGTAQTEIDTALLRAMSDQKLFAAAAGLAATLHGGKGDARGPDLVRNAGFDAAPSTPPFDWDLQQRGDYGATIVAGTSALAISAIYNAGGLAARQLVSLPAGAFRLNAVAKYPIDAPYAPEITLACASDDGAGFAPVSMRVRGRQASADFSVPTGACKWQWLSINATKVESDAGYDLALDQVGITRLR